MRSFIVKAVVVGLAVATASVVGCSNGSKTDSQQSDENSGTVGLALQVAPGVTINTVSYSITGNGLNRTGSIDVTNASQISAVIGGIPAGNGYTITLNALSTDGNTSCAGSATFNVTASSTTAVTVHLQCRGKGKNGSVGVNGTLNVCPTLDSISANPASAPVGGSVALSASGSDVDNAPAALTYAWTATSGTFASASSANTTFTCTAAGTATLTLVVSDSDCSDTGTVTVTCTGTGSVDAGAVDAADAAKPDAADSAVAVTTNSILSNKSASCLSCAQTNGCLAPTCETITGNAAAGPASGTSRSQLCLDTLSCVITAKCAASGTGTPCYCGTASGAACLGAGAANGTCKTQEERGLESTDPSAIATGFGDTTKGGGVANALVQCLNDNSCTTCFQ